MLNVKRLCCVILLVTLCVFAIYVGHDAEAYAEQLPVVTLQSKTAHRGQRFSVEVTLDGSQGFVGMLLTVEYNAEVMTLVQVERGSALCDMSFTHTELGSANGEVRLMWDATEADFSCGCLATLVFDSSIDTNEGDYPITISYSSGGTLRELGVLQPIVVKSGIVTLVKGRYSVEYLDYDGTLLQQSDYNDGDVPSYTGKVPFRAEDSKYSYLWTGLWLAEVSDRQGVLVYRASYELVPQQYQVLCYVAAARDVEPVLSAECSGFYGYGSQSIPFPERDGYAFYGWYTDSDYTSRFNLLFMPNYDLRLYGYFSPVLRESAPIIGLNCAEQGTDYVVLKMTLAENYSLAAVSLGLTFDGGAFSLAEVTRGDALGSLSFDYSQDDDGNVNFVWQGNANDYSNGTLLYVRLHINTAALAGSYDFLLKYNQKSDAIYFDSDGNLWYTKLSIENCTVFVGDLSVWQNAELGISVQARPELLSSVSLYARSVTDSLSLNDAACKRVTRGGYEVLFATELSVVGESFYSEQITVTFTLSPLQAKCNIRLYRLDGDKVVLCDCTKSGNQLIFSTDTSSVWIVTGSTNVGRTVGIVAVTVVATAAACMVVLLVIKRIKANKEAKNDNSQHDS